MRCVARLPLLLFPPIAVFLLLAGLAAGAPPPLPPPEIPAAHQHEHQHPPSASAEIDVGLTEKLGETIPLDLTFLDESGQPVTLRDLIDGPTIIAPVYFHCPDVCNFLQGGLAQTLPQLKLRPGEEFRVLSVSFDETEKPATARGSKKNYMASMGDFPPGAWRFLTGDLNTIHRLTDALGYRFQRQGRDFLHPVAVAVVARDGKIVRYLYGTRFLPMDLQLSLVEASQGKIGASIKRVLAFCFSYDPVNRRYVFNLLRVTGGVVLLTVSGFLAWLVLSGRKKSKRDG